MISVYRENGKCGLRCDGSVMLQPVFDEIGDFVGDYAKLLNELEKDRSLLKLLSENCKERQKKLSWEEKAKVMVEWYKKVF